MSEPISDRITRPDPQGDGEPIGEPVLVEPTDGGREALQSCKAEIQKYVQGIAAGYAARRIRDQELYRKDGYDSITTFIEAELGIGTTQWYYLTKGADIHEILKENRDVVRRHLSEHFSTAVEKVPLPENISWTRPLQAYREKPDLVCRLWATAYVQCDNLTRENIRDVVDDVTSHDADDADDVRGDEDKNSDRGEDNSDEDGSSDNGPGDGNSSRGGEMTRLEKARKQYSTLFEGLNDGVARGLLAIGETIAEGEPGRDALETARASFESLSHRREPEFGDAPKLPGCITGSLDPIEDREILIAFPTDLLTPAMARKAVPVGVPQTQYAMGVPAEHFEGRPPMDEIMEFYREKNRDFSFNSTNENVDWADYTSNPITGCMHDCAYCYAWHQAEGMGRYKQGFQPTFFPGRLLGFSQMTPPEEIGHPREKNVFVGSMSDVFGQWVPEWMIQSTLDAAEANDGFDHLILTKFPQKLSRFDFPDNAWIGTTVDKKHRVDLAERHFAEVDAKVKWLSCEPLLENVAPQFDELSMFDCVVIGAQKEYGDIEEKQPELDWVIDLYQKARAAGCKVYFKENLDVFPKELPEH